MMKKAKKGLIMTLAGSAIVAATFGVLWGFSSLAGVLNSMGGVNDSFELSKNIPSFSGIRDDITNKVSPGIEKDANGNTNILLLGISGEEYISGDLADTIILATINEEENRSYLFSIPRDLWVRDPNGNFQKINELYRINGGTEKPNIKAKDVMLGKVEEITGQKIHYTMIISLEGIEKFVDMIEGVETEEGYMDGRQALSYIRDRSRPGGDFNRMERQQKLLMNIFDKLEAEPVIDVENKEELNELFGLLNNYFATDISLVKIPTFEKAVNGLDTEDVELYTITPAENGLLYSGYTDVGGQQIYTLHPTAGHEDYSEIQNYINKTLNKELDE